MTGKASAAKTAEGAEPVFAHIAGLPQPVLDRFELLFFNRGARVVAVESLDKRRWLGNQPRKAWQTRQIARRRSFS